MCKTVPDLIRIVESSRRADVREGGSVPYQPWVGATGSVRCNFRRAWGAGIRGAVVSVSVDDRGRNEAKIVNEFNIPRADFECQRLSGR